MSVHVLLRVAQCLVVVRCSIHGSSVFCTCVLMRFTGMHTTDASVPCFTDRCHHLCFRSVQFLSWLITNDNLGNAGFSGKDSE